MSCLWRLVRDKKGKICTKPEVNKPGLQCEMHIRLLLEKGNLNVSSYSLHPLS